MNERNFDSAPDMGNDFQQSHDGPERPLEYDAQNWEPTEPEVEEPSEKHLEMHLTPGGALALRTPKTSTSQRNTAVSIRFFIHKGRSFLHRAGKSGR